MKTLKHNVILLFAIAVLFAQAVMPVSAYGDSSLMSDDTSESSEVLPADDEASGDGGQESEVVSSETDSADTNQTAQPSDAETEGGTGGGGSGGFNASEISQAGVAVYASAGPGVLPTGTTMRLKDVSQDYAKATASSALDESVESAQGVDISFYNAEGIEIEPKGNVQVSVQLAGSLEGQSFTLIHVPDYGLAENMGRATSTGANFISDEFSLYVIAGSGTEQDPISNVYREYTIGLGESVTILSDEKNHDGTWIPGISGNSWNVVDVAGGNVNNLVTFESYSGTADVQPRLIVNAKNKTGTVRVAFSYIHPVDKTHKTVTGEFTAKHYYLIHIVDKSSSSYSYSVQFRNNDGTGISRVGEDDLTYATEDGVRATRTVGSDFTHTFTISEDPSTRLGKVTLTMPEYPGATTRTSGGVTYKFIGWSVMSDANSSVSGNNLKSIVYPFPDAHVFKPGDRFPLDRSLTLWAIWAPQDSQKVKFFIRVDDHIPNEPQSHGNASYTEIGSNLTYYLKDAYFASDAIYGVDQGWAEGRNKPWPARVFSDLKAAGKLPADVTDVNIFKARYRIVWSTVKRENDGWHVDGVLYRKDLYNLAYHPNGDLVVVSSMPEGVKDIAASEETLIDSRIPNRYDMIFTGWNTRPDGSGQHYNPGETVVVSEHPELDTSINTLHLYAQWEKSTRYMYHVRYLEADTNRALKAPVYYGSQIVGNRISTLDESKKSTSDIAGYLFSYATPSIGEDLVIGEDNSKNVITLYYMPVAEDIGATALFINKVDDALNPLGGARFKLTGNGTEKTYTSDSNGLVQIPFTEDPGANPGDSLTYTLVEDEAPFDYYEKSNDVFTITVTRGAPKVVSYFPNASKTVYPLELSVLRNGEPVATDGIRVINTYRASGSANLGVTKTLTGRTLEADQFSFELRDSTGVLQTKKNAADGKVAFDPISYTEADAGKTFTYTIVEKNDGKPGYTYDSHTVTATVAVTDNGDGTLKTEVTYQGDTSFTNEYKASGSWAPSVSKALVGRALVAGEFSFELREGKTVLQTKQNAADGTIAFDAIEYTVADIGEHVYTIAEVNNGAGGVTYDKDIRTVTVVVSDNGNGTLKVDATVKIGDAVKEAIAFENTYAASGTWTPLSVSKTLTGRTLEADQFSFELRDATGVLQTKKNAADGTVTFDDIMYTEEDAGKTFTYTIVEKNDGKPGYTYDSHTVTATVAVTDNGDGTLKTGVTYQGDTSFTNEYKASGSWEPSATKTLSGRSLKAGEFSFELWAVNGEGARVGSAPLQTAKNAADGSVAFAPLAYTEADAGKTYTYTISEVGGTLGDVTYDKSVYAVRVTVTDNGDGTLTVDVVYEKDGKAASSPTFTNTFLETLTITYDLNGGNYKGDTNDIVEQYLEGTTISIHEAPTRDGYKFLYWKGSEYQPGDEYTVVDNHRFVAQWEPIQDNSAPEPVSGKLVQTGAGNTVASLIVSMLFLSIGILTLRLARRK